MTRLAAALLVLLALAGPGRAEDERRIRAVRFEGIPATQHNDLRARIVDLIDGPASDERLVEAVRRLEVVRALGGLDVYVRPARRARLADVVFRADGVPRHLAALRIATREQGEPKPEESWRLARQVQAQDGPFASGEGRRYHPYLLRVDAESVLRHFRRRGHRDAELTTELAEDGDLVTATLRVRAGPRYQVASVRIAGVEDRREQALDELSTKAESPVVLEKVQADAERVRRFYCEQGHPDAQVKIEQKPAGDGLLDVVFEVRPGPRVEVGVLRLEGHAIPEEVLQELPLRAGGPFCGDDVSTTEDRLAAFMREHGHADAGVEARVVRAAGAKAGKADVVLTMRPGGLVKIERIWFEGNEVTRESVLRQLVDIEEGDVLRESAVDRSVQALRRSDLFRRAEVRVIRGSRPTTRYLLFIVEEVNQISIDLLDQTLTFRNLDLWDWPETLEDLTAGVALRGRGQELTFYAQTDWQGVQMLDRFLHEYMLARAELFRRTDDFGEAEEVWYTAAIGVGLQAFSNRASLVPLLQLEHTTLEGSDDFAAIPVETGNVFTTAVGVEGVVDLNLRDAERIPYLGFDVDARGLFGTEALGGDLGWRSVDAGARLHLPLGTNDRDQHYVLRLTSTFAHVDPDQSGQLLAHLRPFAEIRGYQSRTIGLVFPVADADDVEIGGTTAASGSAELRVPIPAGRRNAVAPFFDVATVADDGDPVFDNPHLAAGLVLYVSLFSERLEGHLYVAYPFRDEATDREYIGGGLGGSF